MSLEGRWQMNQGILTARAWQPLRAYYWDSSGLPWALSLLETWLFIPPSKKISILKINALYCPESDFQGNRECRDLGL